MRTTLDIDAFLLEQILKLTGARTKKRAIEIAMQEFIRLKQRQELASLIGSWDDFDLSLEDLEQMRGEARC